MKCRPTHKTFQVNLRVAVVVVRVQLKAAVRGYVKFRNPILKSSAKVSDAEEDDWIFHLIPGNENSSMTS